jgi:hypothetical protein
MSRELKQIASHAFGVFLAALAIFLVATLLTYVEDLLKLMDRPAWLQEGVAAISIGLFILDGVLVLGVAGIATAHILSSMWKRH